MSREIMQQALEKYLLKEMPAGTVIGDPVWWSFSISKVIEAELAKPEQEPDANPDLYSIAGRLALELECLLLDTKDISIASKWWDSAHEALDQWQKFHLRACAALDSAEITKSCDSQPESDAMRLYSAVDRLAMQAGEDTKETIDWLCGEHGGMFKLFESYFSPKPLANQTVDSGSPSDSSTNIAGSSIDSSDSSTHSADSAETFGNPDVTLIDEGKTEQCDWHFDNDGIWITSCDKELSFEWNHPKDSVKFCQGCGKPAHFVEPTDEGEFE